MYLSKKDLALFFIISLLVRFFFLTRPLTSRLLLRLFNIGAVMLSLCSRVPQTTEAKITKVPELLIEHS